MAHSKGADGGAGSDARANPAGGELVIVLDGQSLVLRPSFAAIACIEAETGKAAIELLRLAQAGRIAALDAAEVVAACVRTGAAEAKNNALAQCRTQRIADLIYEAPGGFAAALLATVIPLLTNAVTGGYTATGFPKA